MPANSRKIKEDKETSSVVQTHGVQIAKDVSYQDLNSRNLSAIIVKTATG